MTGYRYDDEQTKEAIEWVHKNYKYVVCPHTAIAWQALKDYQQDKHTQGDVAGIFLSTAHPCKFPDVFSEQIAAHVQIPHEVNDLLSKKKLSVELGTDFAGFKDYLLTNG